MLTTDMPIAAAGSEKSLDAALADLGFVRAPQFGIPLTWVGEHLGRQWRVLLTTDSRTRYSGQIRQRQHLGFRVAVQGSCSLATRFFIVPRSQGKWLTWLYRLRRWEVTDAPAPLEGELFVAADGDWARRFASSREAMGLASVLSLQESVSGGPGSSVYFERNELHFGSARLQASEISAPQIIEWIEQCHELARVSERLMPPAPLPPPGFLERHTHGRPFLSAAALLGILGCGAALAGLILAGGVVGLLLLWVRLAG